MWQQNQVQARGVGRRDNQRKLAGGGCGKDPCGWNNALVEEAGSGCEREVWQKRTATDGGAVGRMREHERYIND